MPAWPLRPPSAPPQRATRQRWQQRRQNTLRAERRESEVQVLALLQEQMQLRASDTRQGEGPQAVIPPYQGPPPTLGEECVWSPV